MKPENIFIVRHGQSEGNVDETIYKTKPDYTLELTDLGKKQARNVGKKLSALVKDSPTMFYVSPFWRTRQTAELIRTSFNHVYHYYEDARLREQEWGNHINPEFSDQYEEDRDEYGHFYYRFPNGESCADVYDRVSDFFGTLFRDFEKPDYPKNVILVTHGMTMRVILMRWFHMTVEEFEIMANPSNCSYFHLRKNGEKYELLTEPKKHRKHTHSYQYKPLLMPYDQLRESFRKGREELYAAQTEITPEMIKKLQDSRKYATR